MRKQHLLPAFMILLLSAVLMLNPLGTRQAQAFWNMPHGTYLLTLSDGYLVLITLTPDGRAFSQLTGQFELSRPFGDQQES